MALKPVWWLCLKCILAAGRDPAKQDVIWMVTNSLPCDMCGAGSIVGRASDFGIEALEAGDRPPCLEADSDLVDD